MKRLICKVILIGLIVGKRLLSYTPYLFFEDALSIFVHVAQKNQPEKLIRLCLVPMI
jgi:hypothetical protein